MKQEVIESALWGLLVGDAVGVPYEFHQASELPALEQIDMTPPFGFDRSHRGAPRNAWSDDGAQMLALAESLTRMGHFDGEQFALNLLEWFNQGRFAVEQSVFDYGRVTALALERFQSGVPWELSGGDHERDNGNGSLMRAAPLAFFYHDEKELIQAARASSLPTHRHPVSQLCCALYCLTLNRLANSTDPNLALAFRLSLEQLQAYCARESDSAVLLKAVMHIENALPGADEKMTNGYVVNTLGFALHAVLGSNSYRDAIARAIKYGYDTDTVAAVAGPLAVIVHGEVDSQWLRLLSGKFEAQAVISAFSKAAVAKHNCRVALC